VSTELFVYGTLRSTSDGEAARGLRAGAVRIGEGRVRGQLLDLGAYPGLICGDAGWVRGEVYALNDDRLLRVLDRYEGCHLEPPEYRRVTITVNMETGETRANVWVYEYVGPTNGLTVVEGDLYPVPEHRVHARVAEPRGTASPTAPRSP